MKDKNVPYYKKPAVWIVCISAVACIIIGVFLIVNMTKSSERQNDNVENELNTDVSGTNQAGTDEDKNISETGPKDSDESGDASENSSDDENGHIITKSEGRNYRSEVGDYTYSAVIFDFSRVDKNAEVSLTIDMPGGWYDMWAILDFSDDCVYKANYELSRVEYTEITFDTFAGMMEGFDRLSCMLTVKDNKITEVCAPNVQSGVWTWDIDSDEDDQQYDTWIMEQIEEDNALEKYFTLVRTEEADISAADGVETIEVYTGDMGTGEEGIIVVRDSLYNIIYAEMVTKNWAVRDAIYLGEKDGVSYLMNFSMEERYFCKSYYYSVYRLSEGGSPDYLAASNFDFTVIEDDENGTREVTCDEDMFKKWADEMSGYFENCYKLVCSDGEAISTDRVNEADKYNFETLK